MHQNSILRIIVIAAATFLVGISTTFGWRKIYRKNEFQVQDKNLPYRLKEHVVKLSHEIGDRSVFRYSNLSEAAGYITKEFENLGFAVEFQKYQLLQKEVKNIIARKPGVKKPEEIIVVGAHYDTCFNPGANDNASGVAGLIELARIFSQKQTNRTIKFIAFVNEEPPFFKTENMGSFIYAREAKKKGKKIKAAVILEMIGYYSNQPFSQRYPLFLGPFFPNKANFIAVVGNLTNRKLVNRIKTSFSKYSDFPLESVVLFDFVPGVDFSDHWSFWQHDFAAVMITDTAFYRYKHYHQKSDTYEKLNYLSMAAVLEGLTKAIGELANR